MTAPSARNRSLNSKAAVPSDAPSDASGKKAVAAVMFVPERVGMTTVPELKLYVVFHRVLLWS